MAKLYFRYGAMGSSKSANILMVRYNYEERGQYAVLLKPRTDNRDGEHEIKSRIGLEAPAEYVDEFLKEISETWSADSGEYRYHGKKVDAILIDEAQFLSPEEVDTLSDIVDFYEIPVLCYGLRADFRTRLFPGSMRLMEFSSVEILVYSTLMSSFSRFSLRNIISSFVSLTNALMTARPE